MNAVYVSVIGNHFSIGLVYCLYMYTFILIFDNVFLFKLSEKNCDARLHWRWTAIKTCNKIDKSLK